MFQDQVKALDIEEVVTAPRSPWQSPYVERVIGTLSSTGDRRIWGRMQLVLTIHSCESLAQLALPGIDAAENFVCTN
jgi:hypothetical protein